MLEDADEALGQILVAEHGGQAHRRDHADRDGLTVREVDIISELFCGVADGVAEIQDHAQTGVVLVDGDDVALDPDAFADDALDVLFVVGRGHHIEDFPVGDVAVLDDLGHAVGKGLIGQGGENRWVDEHETGLVECADEVFALGHIHAGLAADRGIDLREQGGRDLAQRDAAQEGRRREAGDVADDATAERDDEILARHAVREQVVIDALDGRETLVLLAGRDDGVRHGQRELLLELFEVERRDGRVRDDVDAARRKGLADNGRRAGEQSAFDMDFGHAVRALQSQQFRHGDSSLGRFLRGGRDTHGFLAPFLPVRFRGLPQQRLRGARSLCDGTNRR